jgi:hypothetical protein
MAGYVPRQSQRDRSTLSHNLKLCTTPHTDQNVARGDDVWTLDRLATPIISQKLPASICHACGRNTGAASGCTRIFLIAIGDLERSDSSAVERDRSQRLFASISDDDSPAHVGPSTRTESFCLISRVAQNQSLFLPQRQDTVLISAGLFSSYAHQMQGLPHLNHNLEDLSKGSSLIEKLGNISFRVVVCSEITRL